MEESKSNPMILIALAVGALFLLSSGGNPRTQTDAYTKASDLYRLDQAETILKYKDAEWTRTTAEAINKEFSAARRMRFQQVEDEVFSLMKSGKGEEAARRLREYDTTGISEPIVEPPQSIKLNFDTSKLQGTASWSL